MISVKEALTKILDQIPILGRERRSILQAQGRVLAEGIVAHRHIPPWDNSAMDGYALRWADIQGASPKNPILLKVLSDLPAGKIFTGAIGAGETVRIMTGAPLPSGADTVVPVENTEPLEKEVKILACPPKGSNIRLAGEDVRSGECILSEGTVLRSAHIGMLASLQRSMVSVYQVPRVAILSTGDELLEIDQLWEEGKIVNSNSYSLAAQVMECGALPIQIGIAKDQPGELSSKMREGLNSDLIITTGGVSVGDYDFVKTALKDLGAMNFWKVAMRPGQPQVFGTISGKPLFGLPGNPVSAMVSFELFVRPSILKMSGHRQLFRPILPVLLEEEVQKKVGLTYFIRCRFVKKDGRYWAITTGDQGSGILSSMVKAQGLLILPEGISLARAGEEFKAIVLDPSIFKTSKEQYLLLFAAKEKN